MTEAELAPPPAAPRAPSAPERAAAAVREAVGWACGLAALLLGLAVTAALPVLQLATLGWLLEAEGRLARGGGLRQGFPGVDRMRRLGSALLGTAAISLPLLVLNSFLQDATLLDPGGPAARGLGRARVALAALTALQATLAVARGAALRHFFLPLGNLRWAWRAWRAGARPERAWPDLRGFLAGLRLGPTLTLGAQGLLAGFLWLAPPSALLALSSRAPGLILLGAPLLVLVLPWLVVAQARLARERRFGAAFELGEIRRARARAPVAFLLALLLALGLALPLYLAKIEPLPRDARWLPALLFIPALLPGRLVAGWAAARAARREAPAHALLRWSCGLLAWPAGAAYVFVVFFSQFFAWSGAPGLLAHHAFLLPVPFP